MSRTNMIRVTRAIMHGAAIFGVLEMARPASGAEAAAQPAEPPEIQHLRAEYEARIAALEARLEALERKMSAGEAVVETSPAAPASVPSPAPVSAGPAQTGNYFNPAMSVIGNFLVFSGHNPVEQRPAANLEESEIGLQAIIDPYAKADFFLSFNDDGAEVEEGVVTFTALPANLLGKVGRMRVGFGKVNGLHPHVLPWADKPLALVNLLGGDEGWIGNGVSLASLLPLGDTFSELTLQAFDGDAGDLFTAEKRSDLSFNGHYRVFRDLTDSSNLEVGASYGRGPNGPLRDSVLEGVDAMYRWKPLRTGQYRAAILRGEYLRSRRDNADLERQDSSGWYLGADYQVAKRWWIGARYDRSDRADDASLSDDGGALTLTFNPSEFSQLRGEYRRIRYAEGPTSDELILQLQFAIGAHGAHPF